MTYATVKPAVIREFAALSGMTAEKAETYQSLCLAAVQEYLPFLNVEPDREQLDRLALLFAATAYEHFLSLSAANSEFSSVTLSDVSVKNNTETACTAAKKLKTDLLRSCADLLRAPHVLMSFS